MSKSKPANPLLWALVALVLLLVIPFGGLVLLPLQYLNTHIHELGHAVAGLVSGAQGIEIKVFGDGSGVTTFAGGWPLLVAPAGYVGATAVGTYMLVAGKSEASARLAFSILVVALSVALLLWVRNPLGFVTGLLYVALCFGARSLRGDRLRFACQFVGLHQVASSLQAILVLVNLNAYGHEHNDALLLANATGIPAMFWAVSWALLSTGIVVWGVTRSKQG